MSAVTGFLGFGGGGGSGTGYQTPQAATIANPTSPGQISTAYTGNQNALQSQQQLMQALQAQNGLANQNQIYQQLQNIIAGRGPNPAQAMLANATGQNVANQAALMAGQRGAASNVGLLARQAAQQGAATQQQAVGQGAALQAQQALNAITGAGNIANTQVANQIGATTANTQAQQQEQQQLLNALQGYNNNLTQSQQSVNAGNAQLGSTVINKQGDFIGGIMQGLGSGLSSLGGAAAAGANGGEVKKYEDGGQVSTSSDPAYSGTNTAIQTPVPGSIAAGAISAPPPVAATPPPVQSKFGQFLKTLGDNLDASKVSSDDSSSQPNDPALTKGASSMVSGLFDALKSQSAGARGGNVGSKLKTGGKVPGSPKVGGAVNSYKNDNVKALLSPGEIVIPRSVTMSNDPVKGAAQFVAKVIAKRKAKGAK